MLAAGLRLPVLQPRSAFGEEGRRTGASLPGDPLRPPGPLPAALIDGLSRRVSYLRISLTDRCNYRCTYCMPPEGVAAAARADLLGNDELVRIVRALQRVGLRRVRLTGGEPTVRADLVALVGRLAELDLDDLALSTNGERLAELAGPLRRAGLRRLNLSIDTLDPARFRQLTRHGSLARVRAGLVAAHRAGFRQTKINTVAMRGFNEDEIAALCRFAWDHDAIPRFIELMPMAEGALFYPGTFLPAAALRQHLIDAFGPALSPLTSASLPGVGPARYLYHGYQGQPRPVGVISAVTEPFCDTCNRIRLSATGHLHACLGHDDAVALRPLLRLHASDEALAAAMVSQVQGALQHKPAGHEFQASGCGGPRKHMVSIGG